MNYINVVLIILSFLIISRNIISFITKADNNNKHSRQYFMNQVNCLALANCIMSFIYRDSYTIYIPSNYGYYIFAYSIVTSIIIYRFNIKYADYDKKNDIFQWKKEK